MTKCHVCNGKGGVTEEQGEGYYVGLECPQCGGHGFSQEVEDELWTVIMDAHGPDSNARDYAKAALLWFALTTPKEDTPDA